MARRVVAPTEGLLLLSRLTAAALAGDGGLALSLATPTGDVSVARPNSSGFSGTSGTGRATPSPEGIDAQHGDRLTQAQLAHRTRMQALVTLAQRGDGDAFAQLYDNYVDAVYRYVFYRVGSHALAEDLTSETFLRALRSIESYSWQGKDIGAWFTTIARNLIADHVKSSRFRLEVPTADMRDADRADGDVEGDVLRTLQQADLLLAVRSLKSEQQECLVLRFLQDLTVAETAAVMGRSEGAVKQLQLRAIRALARVLDSKQAS